MSKYADTVSATYSMLEALTQDAVKSSSKRVTLSKMIMEALNKTAVEMVVLIGLLNLVDMYIKQDENKND